MVPDVEKCSSPGCQTLNGADASAVMSLKNVAASQGLSQRMVVGQASRSLMSSLRSTADGSIRPDAKAIQPEDGEADGEGPARVCAWYQTSFNLMAEIMGTGFLSLPAVMAKLGYGLGVVAIVTFAVAVYYSGFLLAKVRNRYYKHVLSYGDVAYVIHGTWFERLTRWLLYANWYSLLAYYITALTQSFQEAFWWSADTMCFWTYCLVSVAVLLPFAQLRTFHGISWLSLASTIAIVSGVALFAASYITGDTREDVGFVPPSAQVPKQTVMSAWNAFSNIIFSFQGQSEFLEMMGEQKDPRQFPKSLALSQSVMTFMYLFTPLIAYSYVGQNVANFAVASMPKNPMRIVTGVLIAFHSECPRAAPPLPFPPIPSHPLLCTH